MRLYGIVLSTKIAGTHAKQFSIPATSFLFQLRMSRSKPPTGSVEAMFRSTGSEKSSQYQGTDLSSPSLDSFMSDTNHENNTNLSNTTSAPVPKPRSNKPITATQQTSSKLPLSDWDLEDFDNYT